MAPILEFLFPEIFLEEDQLSELNRSNVRRVQYYRFWYNWLCYHDHNDRWSFRDIENYVSNPKLIIDQHIHADKNRFFELIGQIFDLCERGLVEFSSSKVVNEVFDVKHDMLGWSGEGGWGSISSSEMNTLARFVVRDFEGRSSAMGVVIINTPLWFSCDLICQLMEMINHISNVIVECKEDVPDDPFKLGRWDFEPILALWIDKVKGEFLKESWSFQGRGCSPYDFINRIAYFGKSKILLELSREFLQNK
jgi:hypothetical protein